MKSAGLLLNCRLAFAQSFAYAQAHLSNVLKRACVVLAVTVWANLSFAGKTPTPTIYVSSISTNSVSLYWTDVVGGEIDWTLERATMSTGPFAVVARLAPNTTNYTDSTVLPGTTYYYRAGYLPSKGTRKTSATLKVKTLSMGDTVPPSATVTAPAPNAMVAGTITLSATATDNVSIAAVEFRVDGNLVGSTTNAPYSINFDTRTVASGNHSVAATARDAAGNSTPSPAVAFAADNTAPSIPAASASAPSCSQVNVSWSASTDSGSGVRSYLVYKNGTFWREVFAPATSTSDTAVSASTSYSYAVAAKDVVGNQSGNGTANITVPACSDTTAPSVPTNVAATALSCSQVRVSWNSSTDVGGSGLKGYEIYRNGAFIAQVLAPATNLIDTAVAGNSSYTYRISSLDNADNISPPSTATTAVTPVCPDSTNPTVPTGVAASAPNCSQVNLSWNAATDAGGSGLKGYEIYRNGTYIRLVLAPATNLIDTAVAASSSYTYRVSSLDNAGNISALSAAATAITPACADTTAPTVPGNVAATAASCSQVNISWGASTDASGVQSYLVFKNGAFWREVASPATSTSDTSVSPSTSHTYAVAAKDNAGNQSSSSAASGVTVPPCPDTTAPSVPANVAATAPSCSQVNVSWNASTDSGSGVASYMVYRNGTFWREVFAPATSTTDTAVSASTSYSYAVAAKDAAGNQSGNSTTASVTPPACPDTAAPTVPTNLIAAAVNCAQVNLSWKASTDAGGSGLKSYDIYRNGAFIGQILAPATNLIDTTVAPSTAYSYRVSSIDNAGNISALSVAAAATTPACPDTSPPTVPGNVAATATSCSQVTVSWSTSTDAGSGVQSYLVFKNGTLWREVSSTALSTTDTSVSPSTSYSYAVAAKDVAGNQSANSGASDVSVPACPDTTAPTVPANVLATVASCSRIDVTWSASTDGGSGVKGYRIHRNGSFLQEVLAPALSWSDTTVTANTAYSYSVSAFDNAGNVSSVSGTSSATTPGCGGVPGRFVAVTLLGGTDSDFGMAVAVDQNGNFVTGGNVGGRPYFAKLSPSRQLTWAISLANAGSVQAIAVDPTGDIVVSGYFYGIADFGAGPVNSAGGYDLFVAKYSSGGALRWANRYGSPQGADFAGDESGNSVAVDANGNIAVVGSFLDTVDFGSGPFTTRGGKDAYILKLSPNGVALWSKTFGNSGTDDAATSVRFDAANNMFVGGRFSVDANLGGATLTATGSYDVCVAKFTPSGAHLWSKRAGGTGYDTIRSLSVDPVGDVLVTGDYRLTANFDGVSFTTMGEEDVFLVKYSGVNGTQHWAKSFGSWNTDNGNAVGTDSQRNVIIAGRLGAAMNFGGGNVSTPRNGFNIYVAKFAPSGAHLWSKALGNGREDARGLAIDSRNFPFIAGRCTLTNNFGSGVFTNYGNNLNPDMMVLELEP